MVARGSWNLHLLAVIPPMRTEVSAENHTTNALTLSMPLIRIVQKWSSLNRGTSSPPTIRKPASGTPIPNECHFGPTSNCARGLESAVLALGVPFSSRVAKVRRLCSGQHRKQPKYANDSEDWMISV